MCRISRADSFRSFQLFAVVLAEAGYRTSQIQAVYALGRLAIFYKSSGTRHYVLLTLGSLLHFACYSFIRQQAGKVYAAAEALPGCLGLQWGCMSAQSQHTKMGSCSMAGQTWI